MIHELKILPKWFEDVAHQKKTFEIRKNDRNYNVGDTLILKEWYKGKYTGREVKRTVSYIYYGEGKYGLDDEYVVMAIRGARAVLDYAELEEKHLGNPVTKTGIYADDIDGYYVVTEVDDYTEDGAVLLDTDYKRRVE